MNTAQRIRCILLVVVMLVMVGVFVVFRRPPPQAHIGDAVHEKPLILRKNLALEIGDRTIAENQQFLPIPDNAVPIQWDRVEKSPRTVNRPGQRLPHSDMSPRKRRDVLQTERPGGAAPPLRTETFLVEERQPRPEPRYHRIVDGETLRDIAARYLGSPDRFMELFYANRAVLPHPDVLTLGARIVIPDADPMVGPIRHPAPQWSPPPRSETSPRAAETVTPPTPELSPWRSRTPQRP
jgi:hypothetical protein